MHFTLISLHYDPFYPDFIPFYLNFDHFTHILIHFILSLNHSNFILIHFTLHFDVPSDHYSDSASDYYQIIS